MTGERAGGLLLAALAPLVLLAVDPWGWYPFGPIKVLVLTVVGIAGAVLVLGTRRTPVPRPLALALGGLVAAMVAAAAMGEEDLYAWVGTPERRFGVLTWILCAGLLLAGRSIGEDRWPALRSGLLVASVGVGGVATAEALGWEPDVLDAGSRLTGTFGSAAYLGAAAALLLPVMVGFAVDRTANGAGGAGGKHLDSRIGGWIPPGTTGSTHRLRRRPGSRDWMRGGFPALATLVLAVALLGSGTRAAWVGLAVASLVTALARRHAVLGALRADHWRSMLGGLASAVVIAGVLLLTPVGARVGALTDDGAPGGSGRVDEWVVAARVVADHPLLGVGPEGYRLAFPSAVDEGYQRAHGRDQMPDRAHSGPLDITLAGGGLGLAAWVAVVVVVGRSAWRTLRAGPAWLAGIAAGLVAHLVTQLFFFPVAELEPVAWLLAGVVLGADLLRPDPNPGPSCRKSATQAPQVGERDPNSGLLCRGSAAQAPQVGEPDHREALATPRWVVGVAVVVAAAAAVAGATDVLADHHAERAAGALARGDGPAAVDAAEAAVDTRPDILRLHLLAGEAALLDQQGTVAALRHVDAALEQSPGDPVASRTRAALLVARAGATGLPAHRDEAAAFVDGRLEHDPFEPQLWRLRATLAALEGDQPAAEAALERAVELTPAPGS